MTFSSTKFSLETKNFLVGFLLAVGAVVVPGIITLLSSGHLPNKGQLIATGIAGLSAGLTYITRKFFTDDVAAAQKTLQEAQQKAIARQ